MVKEVKKPWGDFKQFVLNEKCTVKILEVLPKQILSLQKHKHRKEMWYFITDGWVQIEDEKMMMKKGSVLNINKNILHRLFSKGKKVEVLEISFGNFDEKDIIRVEDSYGRK